MADLSAVRGACVFAGSVGVGVAVETLCRRGVYGFFFNSFHTADSYGGSCMEWCCVKGTVVVAGGLDFWRKGGV